MSVSFSIQLDKINIWTFLKIIFQWKGSIYKIIWREALFLSILSVILNAFFKYFISSDPTSTSYEFARTLVDGAKDTYTYIPIELIMGFYITIVIDQWYDQMEIVPWPDELALVISSCISSKDEDAVIIRRQIMRYINACFILAASFSIKDTQILFKRKEDFINSGVLNEVEWSKLEDAGIKFYIPSDWAIHLVREAKKLKFITSDVLYNYCICKIIDYKEVLSGLFLTGELNPPLVWTQIAGICVYLYIIGAALAFQKLDYAEKSVYLMFVPPFEVFIYLFYLALYKIAECLMNPFGNTEYNFDFIYLIQRNLQVSFMLVDHLSTNYPSMCPKERKRHLYPYNYQMFNAKLFRKITDESSNTLEFEYSSKFSPFSLDTFSNLRSEDFKDPDSPSL